MVQDDSQILLQSIRKYYGSWGHGEKLKALLVTLWSLTFHIYSYYSYFSCTTFPTTTSKSFISN